MHTKRQLIESALTKIVRKMINELDVFQNRDSYGNGYNVKDGEGQVAVSQALSYEFGLSDERVARIMGTSKRTVFNYRHARRGSNVTSWENRSEENRKAAIARARRLMQGQ